MIHFHVNTPCANTPCAIASTVLRLWRRLFARSAQLRFYDIFYGCHSSYFGRVKGLTGGD